MAGSECGRVRHARLLRARTGRFDLGGIDVPDDLEADEREFNRVLAGEIDTYTLEKRFVRKNGDAIWTNLSVGCVRKPDRSVDYIVVLLQDISERKRAEAMIRQAERRFKALIENAPDGVVLVNAGGTYTYASPSALKKFGYEAEALLKSSPAERTHPDDLPMVLEALTNLMQNPSLMPTLQYRFKDAADSWRWVESTFSNLLAEPSVQAIVINFRDITDRKWAEEALRHAHDDLVRSNTELEQFAYVASHDLQEPLRMVASYLQLLDQRYRGRLDADADEFIGFAVDGAKRMQRLISDLLAYSRVGSRGEPFQPTDCNPALAQALANLGLAIEDSGAAVTHDPLPSVLADPGQLVQLFQNLIGNALKFHGAEPPRVHVSARQTFRVSQTLKVSVDEQVWEFAVRDNGIGFDPRQADRIFAVFQRLYSQQDYPGTGIGLAICKRIVERHGGQIWAEAEPDKGATFYFTLPLTPDL